MKSAICWVRAAAVAVLLLAASSAWAQERGGRWYRAESANFVVYAENDNQARGAAQALEDFHYTLRSLMRVDEQATTNKLDVYLVRSTHGLREIWPGVSEGIGGFYMSSTDYTAAFLVYNQSFATSRRTILFHEYAHHFMLHYAPQAYPTWYVEGWAEYVSTIEFRNRRAIVGAPSPERLGSLADRNLISMEHFLAPERMQGQPPSFMHRFYAQAAFAATYIANHAERAEGLVR